MADYQKLRYRIVTRQAPVPPSPAYTMKDVEALRKWLETMPGIVVDKSG